MFKDNTRRVVQPATLAEMVMHGKSIGIDTHTADDYLCGECMRYDGQYTTLVDIRGVRRCIIHGPDCRQVHKSKEYGYAAIYENELENRRNQMAQDKYALVSSQRTDMLIPTREQRKPMVLSIIEAGIVRREDFEDKTELAAQYLAALCMIHGLSPTTGEISVWPIKRKVGDKWKVTGIERHIGRYAFQRKLEERQRQGEHYTQGKIMQLSPEEVRMRGAHICVTCSGSGKTGSGQYERKCAQCDGKARFDPEEVIVLVQPMWNNAEIKESLALGFELKDIGPIWGEGVWQPGQGIPNGRSAYWVAETRCYKDMLKRSLSLDFWSPTLPQLGIDTGEQVLLVESDGEIVDSTATEVEPEPEPAEEEAQEEMFISPKFSDDVTPDDIGPAQARLDKLDYKKGKPQLGLIKALYGDDHDWSTLTQGMLHNMVTYASKAHGQLDKVKDEFKEACRQATEKREFWN